MGCLRPSFSHESPVRIRKEESGGRESWDRKRVSQEGFFMQLAFAGLLHAGSG